jgi:tryptophan-rich sensory protein
MGVADEAQEKVAESLNAEGRSLGHVALGIGVCLAMIGLTTALSVARPQPPAPGSKPSRHPFMRAAWPALFSVTTLAALRVWNAPSSSARTQALGLWGLLQAANAGLMLWCPRRRPAQIAAAAITAVLTAVYTRAAAHVDEKAAGMVAPTGFVGLASVIATPA